jgi:DNA primase
MSVFNLIKSRVSIFDVVNEYTTLKKAGNYWKSRCPFHHEKTASFTVSPHKGIFYCFGCQEGGDVIAFIAKIENCSQHEAVQFLADRYTIELPEDTEQFEKIAQQKQQHFDIYKAAAAWCHQQLAKYPSVLKYLHQRAIDQSLIDQFMIGYFPGGLSSIKQLLAGVKNQHILADDLISTHIISQGKSVLFSPFEDRIIFPIRDHLGRFCAFGARTYKPEDTRPKYYNSREHDFFQKGSILFGLDIAKKAIQEAKAAFLVEGYTDCIAMVKAGYTHTVATLGTACTLNHLKLLSRYAPYLYLLYDNDSAGQKAILRLAQLCWQAHMELKVVQLPAGQDPASFLEAGNNLKPRIEAAQDIFSFFVKQLGVGFSIAPLAEKITKVRQIIEFIAPLEDPLKQDILLQTASQTFDLPFETLKRELQRHLKGIAPAPSPTKAPMDHAMEGPSVLEKQLFCAILNNVELFDGQNDNYIIQQFEVPLDTILKKLIIAKETHSPFEFDQFFDTLNENEKEIVSKLLVTYNEPLSAADYKKLIHQFQKKRWKQIIQSISAQLAQAHSDGNQNKIDLLLQRYQQLKEKIIPAVVQNHTEEGKS